MRLKNRVAIVTGAARGIGQTFSVCLAKEGAKIVVADKLDLTETIKKIKDIGGVVIEASVDVTSANSAVEMAEKANEAFGCIDILVNNAALWGGLKLKPFNTIAEEEWDAVFAVNVKGIWQCCKAVFPHMKKQHKGSIINIASASMLQGIPLICHYVASKGAVWAITRTLSRELGDFGIRVNSISPGYVMTQASKELSDDKVLMDNLYNLNIDQRIIKRQMDPEDLEGALLFLASEESAFITGQNINVDGGSCHY